MKQIMTWQCLSKETLAYLQAQIFKYLPLYPHLHSPQSSSDSESKFLEMPSDDDMSNSSVHNFPF